MSEVLGKTALEFLHPDDLGIVATALAAATASPGKAAPVIARFRQADGSWRKLECTANNLLDHPTIKGIVVNARDVTERVEAQEKLRLSEEYFRALTEHSTDVTIIAGMDGTVKYASPSLERVFGLKRDDVVGKQPFEFIHPDDFDHLMTSMSEELLGNKSPVAITARARDTGGNWHILEFLARNMLDHPALQGVVINARDVTERETVAVALRQSEERYRLHFANVNDVIYSYDTQLIMQTVSPSVERHLGLRPEDCIGKSILELGVLPPDYLEKAAAETIRVFGGERIDSTVYEFISRDDRRLTAEISSSPIYRDNEVIAVVNVARDITERVRAEEQVRASLAEKEILLKEIHHRVKNNLQIIVSLLSLQSSAPDNPLVLAQFQDSQNRVRTMALIHERLYRSDDLAHIDFGTYLRDLTGYLLNSYEAQGSRVELNVEADEIQLDIDTAIPCELLVNEMVSNALKHAFPNGRSGAIGVEMRCIDESFYQLSIWDDGVGLPANVNHRMTTSLGLQLVNSLTRQLGGTVEVQTDPGTKFTICFPKVVAHQPARVENAQ